MKSASELFQEHTARIKSAIALEKTDRTPILLTGDSFCARHMGVKLSDFCKSVKLSHETMLSSVKAMGDVDAVGSTFVAANALPIGYFSKVKLPGRELPEDAMWQIDEQEIMTVEDYDTILKNGWTSFRDDYLTNRLNVSLPSVFAELADMPQMNKNFEDAGYVVYCGAISSTVNEFLGMGRSFPRFMRDLYKIPDKVEAVLDIIQQETVEAIRQQIRAAKPIAALLSPARGASTFFSPKLWERFVWKYLKGLADAIIEEGAVANIHLDGNWERDLEYFKDFPKGTAIFQADGATDIYKVKEVLGDRMCILGDVPAALLALATPDQVYNYSAKLIKDIGPGLILSSGCSIPANAKVENVKAMVAAANGK
ncbi:MAG TPA: uroporphyrinogen decarboxylase family protein [Negativicutes bacterium]|jgi:hypothetical protein